MFYDCASSIYTTNVSNDSEFRVGGKSALNYTTRSIVRTNIIVRKEIRFTRVKNFEISFHS